MEDAIQFWSFILFLTFVVWPILYVLVDRRHIGRWLETRNIPPVIEADETREDEPRPGGGSRYTRPARSRTTRPYP